MTEQLPNQRNFVPNVQPFPSWGPAHMEDIQKLEEKVSFLARNLGDLALLTAQLSRLVGALEARVEKLESKQ